MPACDGQGDGEKQVHRHATDAPAPAVGKTSRERPPHGVGCSGSQYFENARIHRWVEVTPSLSGVNGHEMRPLLVRPVWGSCQDRIQALTILLTPHVRTVFIVSE